MSKRRTTKVRRGRRFAKAAVDVDVLKSVGFAYALQNYVSASRRRFVLNRELAEYQKDAENYARFLRSQFSDLSRQVESKNGKRILRRARVIIRFRTKIGTHRVFSTEYARDPEDAILFFKTKFRNIEADQLKGKMKKTEWFPVTVLATETYLSYAEKPNEQERQEVKAANTEGAARTLRSQIQFGFAGRKFKRDEKRRLEEIVKNARKTQRVKQPKPLRRVPGIKRSGRRPSKTTVRRHSRRLRTVQPKTPTRRSPKKIQPATRRRVKSPARRGRTRKRRTR